MVVMRGQRKWETSHAFGFVYRQIMRDRPVPSVPVLINTFYPPNQPSARRCVEFGSALFAAIERWQSPARVAVIASGGLIHFVIDEAFDREFLKAIEGGSISGFNGQAEEMFQSGTSEIKNWLPVARAMEHAGLRPETVDYVPCYRSAAGTGNGMGFISWTR
jgi:3-O-methylgallate 3,4-dioxygenase